LEAANAVIELMTSLASVTTLYTNPEAEKNAFLDTSRWRYVYELGVRVLPVAVTVLSDRSVVREV
jgi:hypothetical protein